MNIVYEREVGHCSPTPYAKIVTIKEVSPAENSDFLDRITFEEIGWNCISQRGLHKVGDRVMFIPPDSVLPIELGDLLEVTGYLSRGRVRVTKLRGNRSEGLIVGYEKVEPYLPYIMKWEDLPSVRMGGDALSSSETSKDFEKFYQMPNILNEPNTFTIGEAIVHSEKIHGTNLRYGKLKHPITEKHQLYVGSHNNVLKESEENLYWKVVREKLAEKLPEDIVFFGEIFGLGIQHLHYDAKQPDVRLFAAMKRGKYLSISIFLQLCDENDLPHVEFHPTVFESIEQIRSLADSPSKLTDSHMREGVVLVSLEHSEKMAKCIGFEYLTNKGKKSKRTERH